MSNWSDYPILLAVAETGRRIRALEDHFGTPLITKEGGELVPTTFGHSMLDHIRRMQDEASAIDRSSATLEDSLAGVVLQMFRESHPDILIDLGIGFKSYNLAQREADIALRWMGPGDQNSLIGRKVATATSGLFASEAYLEDLKDHDGVMASIMDDKQLWLMDSNKQPHYLPGRVTFKTNSIWAFDEAIANGYGIGALPLCGACVSGKDNMRRVLPNVSQQEDLFLVAHEDLRRSARIRAVFDFLVWAFAQDAAFFLNGGRSVFEAEGVVCSVPNAGNSAVF